MMDKYILDENGEPQKEDDTLKWAKWFEKGNRVLEQTMIDGVKVSTVFLGIDHRIGEYGSYKKPPILWETMIFGGKHNDEQWRYPTKELALQGHRQACELVMGDSNGHH